MSYTYQDLVNEVFGYCFPNGQATSLVLSHTKSVTDALIDLQTWVSCLQQNNTTIVPQCDTFYNCGVTGCDAPRGSIKKVSVVETKAAGPPGGETLLTEAFEADIEGVLIPATEIGTLATSGAYVIAFNIQNPNCGETGARILTWDKTRPEYLNAGPQYFNATVIYTDAGTGETMQVRQLLPFAACNQTLYSTVNIAANTPINVVIVPVNIPPTQQAETIANITISVQVPAVYVAPEEIVWCSEIEYTQTDAHHVQNYFLRATDRRCRLGGYFALPFSEFDLVPNRSKPARDIGVVPGLPPLPLGFHYAQADTDKRIRARTGLWAFERQNIYIIPWIQSSEQIVIKWDGIKRQWNTTDPVDQDPELIRAVTAYVRKDHYKYYERDAQQFALAETDYNEARQNLIHACREESRIRMRGEASLARAQSTQLQLFYNSAPQTATANCPAGQTGASTSVTIPAGTISSTLSVADANAQALQQAQSQAQAQLNCQSALPTFKNTPQSATVQCTTDDPNAPTPTGGPVTANIPAGQYTSNVSQTDANSQALAAAQAMAESQLSGQCTWSNSPQSYTATCPTGETGSPVTKMVAAGVFTSTISQADANSQALTSATNQANAALVCNGSSPTVYQNTQQQVCITKQVTCTNPLGGGFGGNPLETGTVEICVTVSPNQFTSIISQANANQLAINAATTKAGNYIPPQTTQCSSTVNLTIP